MAGAEWVGRDTNRTKPVRTDVKLIETMTQERAHIAQAVVMLVTGWDVNQKLIELSTSSQAFYCK